MEANTKTTKIIDVSLWRRFERIKAYIRNTKCPNNSYFDVPDNDALLLEGIANTGHALDAIVIAFEYGRCKGYRQAKSEQKNKN